ncbi:MAG: hypothetical protein IIW43_02580 [Selenomonadales bacterium]|jgi:tRNA A22 N-methylase|nr:hypothetical protein [Selenomonadales bacterium]MBQ5587466.1 hypothetical protein [Selenomonadales bacterium]MBQ5832341.1 hypothetical protein [Selenomonadales bacterium]MBQ5860463.1 hypothetical protein [Selenomonadales bacterium]
MTFAKLDIIDLVVIAVLGGALIMAIMHKMNELAMSIASGMIGYIGAANRNDTRTKEE